MAAIQVKNVPDDVHEALRTRADAEGLTLSAYLLELIRKDLRKPRFRAWVDDLQKLSDTRRTELDPAELIAQVRAERDAELAGQTADRRHD